MSKVRKRVQFMGAYNINVPMAWLAASLPSLRGITSGITSGISSGVAAWFSASHTETAALAAYENLVGQARSVPFYELLEVPDTPQGRFELILLHAILVMRRLGDRQGDRRDAQSRFNQRLFDLMFADFDIGLRELGVGDLGVGKRVHSWAAAFRGRAAAYAAALHDTDALAAALSRNVYAQRPATESRRLARYVMTAAALLDGQTATDLIAGVITWPQPEEIA